jgi:hypothetical protein
MTAFLSDLHILFPLIGLAFFALAAEAVDRWGS